MNIGRRNRLRGYGNCKLDMLSSNSHLPLESIMIAATADRVRQNTPEALNERIRRQTQENVTRVARAGRMAIDQRLTELDLEWDIERYVETVAPSLTLAGLTLGLTVNKKWFVVPFLVQGFFLQHAIQGWCPPLPVLRALGVRTTSEIEEERHALKAIRGDYRSVPGSSGQDISLALIAARE
jgi:hypothetical protein